MRIGISTLTYDLNGALLLEVDPDSAAAPVQRRMTRIATMDGGAVVYDAGGGDADITLSLVLINLSQSELHALEKLVRFYSLLRVVLHNGVFIAAVEQWTRSGNGGTFRLLVINRD